MFGTARRGKAQGVYFLNVGYIRPMGAIEINKDTTSIEFSRKKRVPCLQNYLKSEDV